MFRTVWHEIVEKRMLLLLGISVGYGGWAFSLEVSTWALTLLLLFNPYTIYGLVMMWVNRQQLYDAYYMSKIIWAQKYPREKKDDEESS